MMSDRNSPSPEARRQAFNQIVALLPDAARLLFLQVSDHEISDDRFRDLGTALSQSVRRGELSRRAFMRIFGIVGAGGLWSLLFPHRSEAWQTWTGFWQNTQNNPAATYTGPDPYWDYVTLLLQFDGANGATLFPDESNVGKAPTINGAPYLDTSAGSSPYSGRTGSAKFNGTTDYISYSDSSDWTFGVDNFSIEFWVNPASLPATNGVYYPLVTQWATGQFGFGIGLYNSSGTVTLNCQVSTSGTAWTSSSVTTIGFSAGSWHHIAFVRNGSSLTTYIDGASTGSVGSVSGTIFDSTASVQIGFNNYSGSYFPGSLADLRIYKGVAKYTANFTPSTVPIGLGSYSDPYWGYCVLACPLENSLKDCSGKKATANGNAALSSTTKKYGSASASFDGTNSYISIPSNTGFAFGTGDFTLEYFLYLAQAPTSGMAVIDGVGTGQFGVSVSSTTISAFASNVGSLLNVTYSVPTTTWTHIAFVRASGTLYCFVNGTLQGSASCTYDLTSPGNFVIGVNQNLSSYFLNGSIDSLRVTKGYARYTTDFVPPSAGFPVGKDETVDPFWSSTVLAMHMDDLTDATGRHATSLNGTASIVNSPGRFGSGYLNSPASSGLNLGNSADWNFSNGDFTIETFASSTDWTGSNKNIISRSSGSPNTSWGLRVDSGKVEFYCSTDGSNWLTPVSVTYSLPTSQWVHFAVSKQGQTVRIFIDGNQIGSGTLSSAIFAPSINTYAATFACALDDLRITKGVARYAQNFTPPTRAFATTPSTAQTDYDYFYDKVVLLLNMEGANGSTTITDSSASAKTITNNNAVTLSTSSCRLGSAAASFNGTNSFLSIANSADFDFSNGDFTIEAFINPTDGSGNRMLIGKRSSSGGYGPFLLWMNGNTVYLFLASSANTGWDLASAVSLGSISNGSWAHVAITRQGSRVFCFLNGNLSKSFTTSATLLSTTDLLRIGMDSNAAAFNGYIDEVRITKGLARYTSNFAPPARALGGSQGIVTNNLVALLDAGECLSTNAPLVTNLLGASQQFDNSTIWSRGYITLTANAAAAPDGSTTATLFADDSNNQVHDLWQYHTIPSGTVVTMSVYAKAQNWSRVMFRDSGSNQHAVFYLSGSGSVTLQTAGATPTIQALSNGWYRLSVTYTIASVGPNFILRLVDDTGSWTFAGSGTKGIYIWGAQLEASPSAGPYVRTGQNLFSESENFSVAAWTKWASTATGGTTAPDGTSGAYKLSESSTTDTHNLRRTLSLSPSTTYTLSSYVKKGERSKTVLEICEGDGATYGAATFDVNSGTVTATGGSRYGSAQITAAGNGWYRCSMTITTGSSPGTGYCDVRIHNGTSDYYAGDGSSGLYVWGAQLEATSTVGAYTKTPSTDSIPGSRRVGPSSINLLTYSDQFDNAAWNPVNSGVTANATTAPDGNSTADLLKEDSTNNGHTIWHTSVSVSSSTSYVFSCFIKASGRTKMVLELYQSSYGGCAHTIDLSAGTITLGTPYSGASNAVGTITPVGGGWFRCSIGFQTGPSQTTATAQVRLLDNSGNNTYTGDGTSGLYLWGAQLELGNQLGPYVPTTSASATGGGTWSNLVSSPADGSSPAAYDFKFGDGSASTTFPIFTGISGGRSANDYFSFDGTLRYWTLATTPSSFLSSLHKAGAKFTICAWVYRPTFTYSSNYPAIFATKFSGATAASTGVEFTFDDTNGQLYVIVRNGTSTVCYAKTSGTIPTGRWCFVALSLIEAGTSFLYLNGTYAQTSSGNTFDGTYSGPSSLDVVTCKIGTQVDSSGYFRSGDRLAQLLLYNTNLSKSQLDTIFNATRGRYGA